MPMEPSNGQTPWQPGQEVVALYDFKGTTREDLPFKKGDILTIARSTRDVNWYRAKDRNGQEGMIPATYVQERKEVSLHAMPWHHGAISRDEAEDLLKGASDGMFLIRDSVHFQGDFTLSVSCESRIDHYRILNRNNQLEVDGGDCAFDNLISLVESERWFHGKISREEAEQLLKPHRKGLYLVRESTYFKGDFVLCVCNNIGIDHYHISINKNRLTCDQEVFFKTLPDLIKHYSGDADGLCTRLIQPLPKEGNNFFSVSADDFKSGGWTISMNDLKIGESIGKGEFGDVFKGLYKSKSVAIKKLKDNNRAAQTFLKEASLMTSVRHPNLVSLIGIVQDDTIYLVLEFCGKGNLVEYLRSRGRSVITKKDQIGFATDTCSAMAYLETRKLVHRDLAARNVLVNEEGVAKVSDFGLANHIDYNPSQAGGKFPIKWTAPEALRESKFTSKSDMWSFGILLWEIYSFGRVPYPRIPLADVVMHVERGYRMEAPEGCPPEIYTIMTDAWKKDPNERPKFQDVLKHLKSLQSVTV